MRIGRSNSARLIAMAVLAALGLGATSGCGSQTSGDQQEAHATAEAVRDRAQKVAEAWDGSAAAETWRAGYHPMSDVTQPPQGGLRSQADEEAYRNGNFVLRAELPATWPKNGRVVWSGGRSLSRPLLGADEAYKAMSGGNTDGKPDLTVTGVKLGEMTIATSRGPATVPAWTFTLEGYDSPLKRAAAIPSKRPKSPIGRTGDVPAYRIHHLVRMKPESQSVSVVTMHGVCEESSSVEVFETRGSVVLSASVTNQEDGGLCTKQAKLQQVTVKLDRPVDDRVLLDAITGLPVPYRPEGEPSPTWS